MDIIDKIFEFFLKGSTKAKLSIMTSFALFLKMMYDLFGLEYLTMTSEEMAKEIGTDAVIGELLPIDIGTIFIGAIVILLANYGLNHSNEGIKLAKIAKRGAIVIIALSFTPIPMGLSMIPRAFASARDSAELYNSAEYYEEFVQYVDVSKTIALTDGATKNDVEDYLKANLTELGRQDIKTVTVEEVRDYVKITLEFNDSHKDNLIYSMSIDEVDYPTAYYQMKYGGRTVLGCEEELNFKWRLEFGDMIIPYPSMMYYTLSGVDTIYGYAEGMDEQTYEYKILIDSTSMYKSFAPYLANSIPSQMSALPNYCKDMVYEAANFLPGNGSQTIDTSQTMDVNGVSMQRTTGALTGSEYGANGAGVTYRYVAYYFFVEENGVSYPAIIIALGNEQIESEIEYYIDKMILQVSRKGTESVDATEF